MIDFKQLKYFMVSADVSSFSEAAKILYTTQSNVSKAIMALEKSLGIKLFYREARGISLTAQGKNVYRYASRILEGVDELENMTNRVEANWLNISSNPSSWFARRFAEFYNAHYEEHLHCRVQSASVGEIMNRVRDCRDELGFVYVFGHQRASFQYELDRHHLEFVDLASVEAMLYLGKEHPFYGRSDIRQEELDQLRYVQIYQDEFTDGRRWVLKDQEDSELTDMDVAVVTNSDYIMEMMLTESKLANISGSYLSKDGNPAVKHGISLEQKDGGGTYGYVKRRDECLGKLANEFVEFIRGALG